MKVMVTGATGFIGKHVVPRILDNGCGIIATTRTANQVNKKLCEDISFVEYDITEDALFDVELIKDVDALLYLAWGHVHDVNSNAHLHTELPAHYRFIKNIIKSGIKNIFVLGSCYEYGLCEGSVSEDYDTKPVTKYGIAKDRLRIQLKELSRSIPFNMVWARLFYVYGKYQVPTSIYSQLIAALDNGDYEFEMSKGDQLFDFISVSDAADLIVKIFMQQRNLGCINICSGVAIELRTLVNQWISENKGRIKLKLGAYPYRSYESRSFWGNTEYLADILKYECRRALM